MDAMQDPSTVLSEEQIERARRVFDQLDGDGDGAITPDELTGWLQALGADAEQVLHV